MTDNEPEFPRKFLLFYNKGLAAGEEGLSEADVQQLRGFVDDYYARNLPRQEESIYNKDIEESDGTMSSTNFYASRFPRKDMSTDVGLLRSILNNAKFVHPSVIDRFIDQYELNKPNFDRNPLALKEYMEHVFTRAQGEQCWKIFQESRGHFVPGSDGQVRHLLLVEDLTYCMVRERPMLKN